MAKYLDQTGLQTVADIIKDKYHTNTNAGTLKLENGWYDLTTGEPIAWAYSVNNVVAGYRTEKFVMNRHMTTARDPDSQESRSLVCVVWAWDRKTGDYIGYTQYKASVINGVFEIMSDDQRGFGWIFGVYKGMWWTKDFVFALGFQGNVPESGTLQLLGDSFITNWEIDEIYDSVFTSNNAAALINEEESDVNNISEVIGIGDFE